MASSDACDSPVVPTSSAHPSVVAACAARAAPSSLEKSITTSASPALTCSSSSRSIAWMIWHPRSAGMLAAMR